MREDGIIRVVHSSVGNSLKGKFEHGCFNLFLVVTVGSIDTGHGFFHDRVDDFSFIIIFDEFCFFQEILSSSEDMIFE